MTVNEVKGGRRYVVRVVAKEALGHKGVTFYLFHPDDLPEEVYARCIPAHLDRSDPYLRSAVEDTFSSEEAERLRAYLARRHPEAEVIAEGVELPLDLNEHCCGQSALPIGGNTGHYMFSREEGCDLPFKVYGFYNLHGADSGPYRDHFDGMAADLERVPATSASSTDADMPF
jgi:hypothetical protein